MATRNNRTAGHNFEREVIKELKEIFPDCVSSRSESRNMDNKGVDFCYTGPLYIQAKTTNKKLDYPKILESMPDEDRFNVIVHKFTQKAKTRFVTKGKYAILEYDDFLELLKGYLKSK